MLSSKKTLKHPDEEWIGFEFEVTVSQSNIHVHLFQC